MWCAYCVRLLPLSSFCNYESICSMWFSVYRTPDRELSLFSLGIDHKCVLKRVKCPSRTDISLYVACRFQNRTLRTFLLSGYELIKISIYNHATSQNIPQNTVLNICTHTNFDFRTFYKWEKICKMYIQCNISAVIGAFTVMFPTLLI